MKYKLLKAIESENSIATWTIFDIEWDYINIANSVKAPCKLLIEQGFIEEVKEIQKPRWKVGDYAVCKYETLWEIDYIKIYKVNKSDKDSFYYNDEYKETCLRDPTPEELSTYFR